MSSTIRGVGPLLAIAVVISVAWLVRLLVGRVAEHDRALQARGRAEDQAAARVEAALERPGLLPDRPLVVESAAAVEPRAEAEPCPICGGPLHADGHAVDRGGRARRRRIELRCGDCGRRTTVFVEIVAPTLN